MCIRKGLFGGLCGAFRAFPCICKITRPALCAFGSGSIAMNGANLLSANRQLAGKGNVDKFSGMLGVDEFLTSNERLTAVTILSVSGHICSAQRARTGRTVDSCGISRGKRQKPRFSAVKHEKSAPFAGILSLYCILHEEARLCKQKFRIFAVRRPPLTVPRPPYTAPRSFRRRFLQGERKLSRFLPSECFFRQNSGESEAPNAPCR